ncbi:MAG: leucine-rich repeat domain-containing protein [Planctomycetes bacterium]|nr:leucine-rich repeat domain-containing protein [Planctomycetota bacterium]
MTSHWKIVAAMLVSTGSCFAQSPELKRDYLAIERDGGRLIKVVTADGTEFIDSVTFSYVENSDTKIRTHAAKLSRVTSLMLNGSDISDVGIEELKALPKLRQLELIGAKITIKSGKIIGQFKSLRHLSAGGNGDLSDDFVDGIVALNLETLHLSKAKISSRSLGSISKMTNLRELDLSQTNITDADLAKLKSLTSLEILDLSRTKISDASLDAIGELPKLKVLNVADTEASPEGIAELQEARPDLKIEVLALRIRR